MEPGASPRTRAPLRAIWRAMHAGASRRLWIGGALAAVATVLMGMALLGLSGWFITATAIAGLLPGAMLVFDVFMPSAGIRLLALGRTGSRYAERLITHEATLAALAALRERLFRAWSTPQAARHLLSRPARLLQRLTADVDALDNVYLRLLVPAIAALGSAMVVMLAFGAMRWWLGLVAGIWLIAAGWGIALWLGVGSRRAAVRSALSVETMRARVVDLVAGKTDLLMAQRVPAQCASILAIEERAAHADARLYRAEARAAAAYGVVNAVTLAASLMAMAWLVEQGRIGAAVAALGLLFALSAMEPFAALSRGASQAGRTWLAARRLGADLARYEARPAPPLSGEAARPCTIAGDLAVTLRDAGVRHDGAWMAGPLNLTIARGERVAVIGASGAGKTTLLSLVAGEVRASSGEVHACRCSWMTQRTELFQDSLRDNLRLANPQASDEQLQAVIESSGLAADIGKLPEGLDTRLGEGGLGMSAGQSRRLALARLMLSPAPCWLLDEVSEGLDAAIARDVMERLARAARGRTLLLVTHWRREAVIADRIVRMEHGRITGQAVRGTEEFTKALATLRADAHTGAGAGGRSTVSS